MNPLATAQKKQEEAGANVLVSLNSGAGVNHQNGAGLVPELWWFAAGWDAVNRLESLGGSSFATVFASSCMAYTRVLDF
jgi:hypothetical protein